MRRNESNGVIRLDNGEKRALIKSMEIVGPVLAKVGPERRQQAAKRARARREARAQRG